MLALCMEAGRYGLLLPLLSEEAGSPSLVQRLVILVDDVTRRPEGELSNCPCQQLSWSIMSLEGLSSATARVNCHPG